jgi:hypothetical protein
MFCSLGFLYIYIVVVATTPKKKRRLPPLLPSALDSLGATNQEYSYIQGQYLRRNSAELLSMPTSLGSSSRQYAPAMSNKLQLCSVMMNIGECYLSFWYLMQADLHLVERGIVSNNS